MKTQDEMKNVPSFDELVFENRNLEYGAYQIRKKYNVALVWSILVSVFFVSATVVTPFVIYDNGPVPVDQIDKGTIMVFDSTLVKVNLPIEEPPKTTTTIPKIQEYVAPKIVDSIPLAETNTFGTAEENTAIATNDSVNEVVPTSLVEIDPPVNKKDDIIWIVEEKPFFGTKGDNEFRGWISDNIIYPLLPLENGIQGRVLVQFVVERDGSLSNFKIVRSVDPELDNEAIRVLKLSPKWNPGKQQGKPVRVGYTFPITFVLK